MINKVITWLLGTAEDLQKFEVKKQEAVQKYANKQVKKAGVVCFLLGLVLGILL